MIELPAPQTYAPASGPAPRQQHAWDTRAATNFMAGGAGAGLIVFSLLWGMDRASVLLPLAGVALIAVGLLCVWLELGRPARAFHVFFNPRRSWMSREALVATALVPVTLGAVAGIDYCRIAAVVLALAFVFCQSRIVQGARGIPTWSHPRIVPLLVSTGLAEGAGLFCAAEVVLQGARTGLLTLLGALMIGRLVAWLLYRRALHGAAPAAALVALDDAEVVLQWIGTFLPLLLLALALVLDAPWNVALTVMAGVLVAATGAWIKYIIVARAGFLRGFVVPCWPVRGVRRTVD